ncbi:DUF6340 family protein [Muriicola sp. Z0-33]|uniref:DUF6340 family protein n=1 Tax=Muriicola sp. Z0-33 TaxID=2816957 RepID=UPI00223827A3|nr:DUF6340 family protein [Muriicola sp. Z0-33]MCW5515328.1 hypothetical protein [Muriicola sp. Z0-33]
MIKHALKYISIVLCAVLTACSTTHQLSINTVEPAPVDLAHNIRRIGIINSSIASERAEYKDRLDQILSSEDQELVKQGTDAALNGLFQELVKDSRFEKILLLENVPEVMKGIHPIPDQRSWTTIEELCRKHDVDAIFSLAFYDTDTKISLKKTKMEQRDLMRDYVEVKAHEITLETLIENGWRIYDPQHKEVIDEFTFNDQITSTAKGISPIRALRAITDRKDAVLDKSMDTGSAYGSRLQPSKQVIYRDYYINGTESLEQADILAQKEDFEGATELWKKDITHSSSKIRARACYNLAVYQEYKGDLSKAMEWASKSYEHAKSKSTQHYIEALENRITQQELLAQQMAYIDILRP